MEKNNEVYTIERWDNYSLKSWVKKDKNKEGKKRIMFNYEIQRSQFKGTDDKGNKDWENTSISLAKLSDLAYLKKLLQILIKRESEKEVKINHYFANKINTPTKKDPKKKFLSTYRIYREYFCKKENKTKNIKEVVLYCYDLEILLEFVKFCTSKISDTFIGFEKNLRKEYHGDSKENYENSFIETREGDEIPF